VPVFFWGLGRYGVVNGDEAIYHAIAERMVATGDWLRLDFRGEPRFYDSFMNAPLHYFARAALIELFGSGRWTMRVLSAAAGAATVLATAGLAARQAGSRAALLAGLVQLSTFQFVWLHGARTGELDALATLLFVGIAWLFLRAALDGRSFVPHHLALIALAWTKLPLVLVPLAVEAGHFAASSRARPRLRAYLVSGAALAPLALSWHAVQLALWWDQVPAVAARMWGQASGAVPDSEYVGRLDNAMFYLRTLAWGAFPWSAALPFALLAALREPRLRALLAWPLALGVFFALVAKHYPWYVLPATPFFAIALGSWLAELPRRAAPALASLAAASVVATLLCVDATPANPLAEVALVYPMRARLAGALGAPALVAGAAGAVLAAGAMLAAQRRGGRAREVAGFAHGHALVATAAWRGALPQRQLGHQSELDLLRAALDRARAAGQPIEFPVRVPPGSPQIARFLFGEDFEIEARATPAGTTLWLQPKGDPAVLGRSIGRLGLERRLARPADP